MTTSQRQTPGPDFDMIESKTLPRRSSRLPGGERSDRDCTIRVRRKRPNNRVRGPITRNVRAKRAYSDLSPTGRGEEELAQPYRKMRWRGSASDRRVMSARNKLGSSAPHLARFKNLAAC